MATDDVIGNDAAASLAGVRPGTWRTYVTRGQAPQPYRHEISRGHALPVWRRSALTDWLANRPGQGARTDRRRNAVSRSAEGDQ